MKRLLKLSAAELFGMAALLVMAILFAKLVIVSAECADRYQQHQEVQQP